MTEMEGLVFLRQRRTVARKDDDKHSNAKQCKQLLASRARLGRVDGEERKDTPSYLESWLLLWVSQHLRSARCFVAKHHPGTRTRLDLKHDMRSKKHVKKRTARLVNATSHGFLKAGSLFPSHVRHVPLSPK